MTELNKYNLYNLGFQNSNISQKYKVDEMIDRAMEMEVYQEVKDFIFENFGEIEGEKWINFPELNKEVYVNNELNKVEICMLKNHQPYYGKYWIPYEKK